MTVADQSNWGLGRWGGMRHLGRRVPFGALGLCYVAIYLGLGLLLMRALRRFLSAGLLTSALVQILLLLVGCGAPLIIQLTLLDLRNQDYTLLQISDPFWTLAEVIDRPWWSQTQLLLIFVPLAALVVFALNLPGLSREIRSVRIIKPQRVIDEDAERAAARKTSK